jgi:LEA14-like dessication related protein
MKRISNYLTITLLALTLSSCLEYKEVKVVQVIDVGIKDISVSGVAVEVAMQIKNPNNYNIKIIGSDLNLFLKGNKMGAANLKNKVILKKKSNAVYRFTLQSNFKDLALGSLPVLMGLMTQNEIEFHIVGHIKAQAKGISKKVPIDFTEKVKL